MARHKACSQRHPDQSTSHRWLCFSQRRRTKKPNKLVSISKYQSYHRHHLIRISSCHKLQLRAKKTKKKTNSSQFPSKLRITKKKSSYQSKINHASIPLQHAFNWKVVLLPSRIVRE